MPQWNVAHNPEGTTMEEFRKLLQLRLDALHEATRTDGSLFPMPVRWRHGWKAHIRIEGRDRDGSLCAHIVVRGPSGGIRYIRRVRLVRSQPLRSRSGKESRET